MKIFRTLFTLTLFSFSTLSLFSQTQSLWSQIKKDKSDSVGLNALQYQAPLWGELIDFYDMDKIKGKNDGAGCHTWLVRDFNNDGFVDIFLAFFTGEAESVPFMLLIYDKNTGTYKDQSFRIKNNIGETFNRKTMAADFNGDGILDVVAISNPEKPEGKYSHLDILLSNPDTTWTQIRLKEVDRFKNEGYYHGVAVGDIDNDGDIDIVLGEENNYYGGSLSLINDGKGNFKEIQVTSIDRGFNFQTRAWTLELADINGDGCLDLFYSHDKLNTRILYGNCKETFDNAYQDLGPLVEFPYFMDYDIRDFDRDGDLDLLLTTTYDEQIWQLAILENKGSDSSGKVIWENHSNTITKSLKTQGFYDDSYSNFWVPYVHVVDINSDGFYDIIPQKPLSNVETFNQWILLGDGKWNFKYKKLPFAEPPKTITSSFNSNKVNLMWKRVKQSYSTSDGGISKWAIYASNKNWGDRSQVSKSIIVSSSDTKSENGFDQFLLEPTSKEMFIRISPIDSTGIEWPLSNILKVSILPPSISSATICDGNALTITGTNFVGITKLTVGSTDILSYSVISDKTIQATLNTGQSGIITLSSVAGSVTFSNVTTVIPSVQTFAITGNKSPFKGEIETYSVPESFGVSFSWIFPDGWIQVSGGNSNIVTVKTGTVGGIIQVVPSAICGTLKPISLPVSAYTYVPDDNFQKALRELGIDKENKLDSILTSSIVNVSTLSLNSKNISDLTGIQDFPSLKHLECRDNQLKVLDLSGNPLLEELFCTHNKLTNLDLSKNVDLTVLFCDENQLSVLDISKNISLLSIGCGNNPLTSLNVSNNKNLVLLSIFSSTVSSIDLSNNSKLNLFHCGYNRFTQLDVSKNLELSELACDGNQFTRLDLSNNTKLTRLICNWNNLSSLNLKNGNNASLKQMYADNNPNLTCINVDNPTLAYTYSDWKKDVTANYSEKCIPLGIKPAELNKSIVIYPNPTSSIFKIEGLRANPENRISVYSVDGILIKTKISNSITETIDLSGQASGVYLLFVNNQPFKIMKE